MGWLDFAGAVVGAGVGFLGAKDSADAISSGNAQAAKASKEQYYQTRKDMEPWRGAGRNALYTLSALSGVASPDLTDEENQKYYEAGINNFQASPSYNFRMGEGLKAIDRSAASRGRLRSGASEKALMSFGQGLASQEYDKYTNRLATLAGVGQTATNQTAAYGANNASTLSGLAAATGNARASGYAGQARALNQGIQNALMVM